MQLADKLGRAGLAKSVVGEIREGSQLKKACVAGAQREGTKTSCRVGGVHLGNDSILPCLEKNTHGRKQIKLQVVIDTLPFWKTMQSRLEVLSYIL